MKWIIIDSVVSRARTLQQKLSLDLQVDADYIRFLDDNPKPEQETLYLIHNSDGYVNDFANKSKSLKDTFVVFYSGGGLSLSSVKSIGEKIGFFDGVFHNGDESNFFLLLMKVKAIFDSSKKHKEQEFQSVFDYDHEEEILTDEIFNAIYEQKEEEAIDKAVSKRDKYLIEKGKF